MSRYTEAHKNTKGPGDARPTALQVVKDNNFEGKLVGKYIVITGVSSGLGIETVRALAATGAKLFLTARDLSKAKEALAEIWDEDGMELVEMDQASLDSVRAAAKAILSKTDKISILVANAGIMAVPSLQLTKDGFETHFAVNHLSHFLLFQLLKPALLKASTPDFQSRVVLVGAAAHRIGRLAASDDYAFEKSEYEPWLAYARSKTANTYMANEIERRYGPAGIHATSLHPGVIATRLARFLPKEVTDGMAEKFATFLKSAEQGAATTLVAAVGKEWEGRGGVYLNDCEAAKAGTYEEELSSGTYVPHTYDVKEEARLWKDSLRFVGLPAEN